MLCISEPRCGSAPLIGVPGQVEDARGGVAVCEKMHPISNFTHRPQAGNVSVMCNLELDMNILSGHRTHHRTARMSVIARVWVQSTDLDPAFLACLTSTTRLGMCLARNECSRGVGVSGTIVGLYLEYYLKRLDVFLRVHGVPSVNWRQSNS